jgi:hypothetical protein
VLPPLSEADLTGSNLTGAPILRFCLTPLSIAAHAPHQAADSRTWNLLPVASA